MKAKELKSKLTIGHILKIMEHLGAECKNGQNDNEILFKTICHCGSSYKLYFYKDTKEFHCYSNCGQQDIINIVENVLQITHSKAKEYICRIVGIDYVEFKVGFEEDSEDEELESLSLVYKEKTPDLTRDYKILDKNILNGFYDMYHPSFLNDGISVKTLRRFGIKYDILEERIIIPHYDENGELIAIRCRNLKKELLLEKKKYTPIVYNGKLLSAKTRMYLYGLNFTKGNIRRIKKVILFEAEKAVMQLDSFLGENNFSVALSSSSMSAIQVELLKELGVEEVIIALDKEYQTYGSKEEKLYAMKIRKGIISKLLPHFTVSVIWDVDDTLEMKDSPTDKGKEVFLKLYNNRIFVE